MYSAINCVLLTIKARRYAVPRMKILNTVEQEAFDMPPVFNSVQRKLFFDFPMKIRRLSANLRTPTNQLCFLLGNGYFKASKRFFSARTFHSRDIRYVAQHEAIPLDDVEGDCQRFSDFLATYQPARRIRFLGGKAARFFRYYAPKIYDLDGCQSGT